MSAPEATDHERHFWELTPAERESTLARMAVEVFSEVHCLNPQIAIPSSFSAGDLRRLVQDITEQQNSRGGRALVVVPLVAGVLGLFKYFSIQASRGDLFAPQVVQALSETWWGLAVAAALGILIFDAAWSYFNPPPQRIPASLLSFASELAEAGASGEIQDDQLPMSAAWLQKALPISLAQSSNP